MIDLGKQPLVKKHEGISSPQCQSLGSDVGILWQTIQAMLVEVEVGWEESSVYLLLEFYLAVESRVQGGGKGKYLVTGIWQRIINKILIKYYANKFLLRIQTLKQNVEEGMYKVSKHTRPMYE